MEDTTSMPHAVESPEQNIPAGDPATDNSTTPTNHAPDTTPTSHAPDTTPTVNAPRATPTVNAPRATPTANTPDDTMPPTGSASAVDETPPPHPEPTALSEQQALTTARLMQMLSEAEERGYMRARRELTPAAPTGTDTPLWGDPRRIEAERQNVVELGDEFLSTIRPTIWD